MGIYINGIGESKVEKLTWLADNAWFKRATKGDEEPKFNFQHYADKGRRIVCAVDNGDFIAIAVAYSERELDYFCKADGRPKAWYTMSLGVIKEKADGWKGYL